MKAFFLLILSACSLFSSNTDPRASFQKKLSEESKSELSNHLKYLGEDYLKNLGKSGLVELSNRSNAYLLQLYERITSNNELIFPSYQRPKFYIINQETPFHFSLPGGMFFISKGLIKRYVANEDLLAAVLAAEIFRSEKGIYEKKIMVPVGIMDTIQMLSLVRLPVATRAEINKWSYLLMKRSLFDPGALLNLIQLKNKNAIDFVATVGNISTISKEEFNFKNFLSKTPSESDISVIEKNSTRGFYALRRDME